MDQAGVQGEVLMSISEDFTPEEWARVVAAPMVAGIAVTAADPGGLWGALKESASVAGALRAAKTDAADLSLIHISEPTRPTT